MAERLAVFGVLTLSSVAGNIANSLHRYADELPESSQDIRAVLDNLLDIRSVLRDLDAVFQDPRFNRLSRELLDDIVLGIGSCSRSLRELDGIVLRYTTGRRVASSRRAWYDIQASFRDAEGYTLAIRLDVHRTFLLQLKGILQYKPDRRAELAQLQEQIRHLATSQERVAHRMRELEESQRRAAEEQHVPTYMPRYPLPLPSPPYDTSPRRPYTPISPTYSAEGFRYPLGGPGMVEERPITPATPISPVSSSSSRGHRFSMPTAPMPMASTPPPIRPPTTRPPTTRPPTTRPPTTRPPTTRPPTRPPTRSASRTSKLRGGNVSNSSSSSSNMVARPGWWSGVFDGTAGSHGFRGTLGAHEGSQCLGMQMDTLNMAPEEVEIIKVEFDNDLTLRLFRHADTEAAKVVCTVGRSGGWLSDRRGANRFQTFIDAAFLSVVRAGSSLHLKRRGILWACLYFADIENMVLFYHTFLALRFYGPDAPVPKKSEYWLDGEDLLFSGEIDDEGYVHMLRVLRDRDSGVVRLASANVNGDYTDVTIWTAFISEYLKNHEWAYYARNNTIILKNLRQFSFSVYFETNTWKDYELRFRNPGDARCFERVMNEVRVGTYF